MKFVSTDKPSLFIPYRSLPATAIQLVRGLGVQFRAGVFETDDTDLITALRELSTYLLLKSNITRKFHMGMYKHGQL
ncbi:MAG TPA: hypothetical protein VHT96_14480 [Clostridia bacterium]|nr:hypothetical protein [Clostridia bacterium]